MQNERLTYSEAALTYLRIFPPYVHFAFIKSLNSEAVDPDYEQPVVDEIFSVLECLVGDVGVFLSRNREAILS